MKEEFAKQVQYLQGKCLYPLLRITLDMKLLEFRKVTAA